MMMGDEARAQRLLITAQQTEYKNAVLSEVSRRLERDGLCMEVIDVVHLEQVEPTRQDAMLLSCASCASTPRPRAGPSGPMDGGVHGVGRGCHSKLDEDSDRSRSTSITRCSRRTPRRPQR
jgi:hypothetical protein